MSCHEKIIAVGRELVKFEFLVAESVGAKSVKENDHEELRRMFQKVLKGVDVTSFTGVFSESRVNADILKAYMQKHGLSAKDLSPSWPWKTMAVVGAVLVMAVLLAGLFWLAQGSSTKPDEGFLALQKQLAETKTRLDLAVAKIIQLNNTIAETRQVCKLDKEAVKQELREQNAIAETVRDERAMAIVTKAMVPLEDAARKNLDAVVNGLASEASALKDKMIAEANATILDINQTASNTKASMLAKSGDVLRQCDNVSSALEDARDRIGAVNLDLNDTDDRNQKAEDRVKQLEKRTNTITSEFARYEAIVKEFGVQADDVKRFVEQLQGQVVRAILQWEQFNEIAGPWTLLVVAVAVACVAAGAWAYQAVTRARLEYRYAELQPSHHALHGLNNRVTKLEREKGALVGASKTHGFGFEISLWLVVQLCVAAFMVSATVSCMHAFSQGLAALTSPIVYVWQGFASVSEGMTSVGRAIASVFGA
jgi:hypothetical protein